MKRKVNYGAKLATLRRAMLNEMWSIIEQRAETDSRYDAPIRWAERIYDGVKNFCEVDINGYAYAVSGIRLEKPWHGRMSNEISLTVISDGYHYGVSDIEGVATILTAMRRQRVRKAA